MLVHVAEPSDVHRLLPVVMETLEFHRSYEPTRFQVPRAEGVEEYLRTHIENNSSTVRFTQAQGVVSGFVIATLIVKPDNAFRHAYRKLELDQLGVIERFRRQGLATELTRAALEWGRQQHAEKAQLTVWHFNDEAHRLYSGMGFETVRTHMGLSLA